MNRASFFIPLVIFILIMGIGYVGFNLDDRHELPSALLGKPFPQFSAPLLSDPEQQISRENLIGQPALVNVWATWCPTCKAEHEELNRIAATTDILLVGINYKDVTTKAKRWLADYGDPFDFVIVDADGALGIELGVYGAPETFLLNARGEIVYKRVGDINPRIWRDELAPRLAQLGVSQQRVDPPASGLMTEVVQ
ncbi:MAG: DsbE family thiol:disulfide interchange protein [Pseudomonadales bacterium]|jgi:cytochrome c biogenesis protein CcmG, thiol:disulfide interchange protein DsbE|nr:DsbE family thiol:disulfide interchange protein [Pseudomonadales bacterium]